MAKRAVNGDPSSAVKKGDDGYDDWVIIVIHGLREYLDLPYRRLLNVLHEMHGVVEKLDLEPSELPDFTTVCAQKQQLKMAFSLSIGFVVAYPVNAGLITLGVKEGMMNPREMR